MTSTIYSADTHTSIAPTVTRRKPLSNGARVLVDNQIECDCSDCAKFVRKFNGTMVRLNGDLVDVRSDSGSVDSWPVDWVTVAA